MAKMNGLDNITRKITEDALADAEKYRAEARAEAEKVLAMARAEGAAQGGKIIEKARAEAKNIAQRTESQANMEVRSAVLSARRRAMDNVFSAALNRLRSLSPEEYVEFMARLIVKNQTSAATVVLNAHSQTYAVELMRRVREYQDEPIAIAIDKEIGNFSGGFILRQGRIETNCTFETLLGGVHNELEGEIMAVLFG